MKLLMITGDRSLAQGKMGPFYYMLQEFSKYWERIDIICPKTEKKVYNVHGNVYVHVSDKSLIFHPFFILKEGNKIYKEQKFDLFTVHSYPPFYNDIGGLKLFNKIKVPFVLEIMHINGHPKASGAKEWFYKILTKKFIKHFSRKSQAIRVINHIQVPEFLIKSGTEKEKIKVVPAFYIDFEVFKPMILAVDGASTEKKYDIVFSGRLVKNKGINLLLKATKQLMDWKPSIKLAITGSGPLENKIKKFIKNNKLKNNIDFIGWVRGTDELAKIYNQSKMLVMSSFNEGGPRVTLEAMACKTPVLTSRVGIMLDIIQDFENGIFIDWDSKDIAEKIKLLLNNEELRIKIAENGYRTVQQFERKSAIKNYAEQYQTLLHTSRL